MEFDSIAGYDVMSVLGRGARSTIYEVGDGSGDRYALKRVVKQEAKDQRFLDQAMREHEVASRFEHPLLRRSFKLIRQRKLIRTNEVLVLMELVRGTPLDQSETRDVRQLVDWTRQVATALGAMHMAGYIHADIKPSNVLAGTHNGIKIIDFGQSCPSGTVKERIQGTPDFIAPEQVLRRQIVPQTDVFNLGATLYWLLTRRNVPTMIPKREAAVALKTEESDLVAPHKINPLVPPALSTLVMQCVEGEASQRPENMKIFADRLEIAHAQIERGRGNTSRRKQKTA